MKIFGLDALNFGFSGNNTRRIFNVNAGKTLTLQNLKLFNTASTSNGGAIYNNGMVNLKNVNFQNNYQGGVPKAMSNGIGSSVKIEGLVNFKL